MRLRIVRTRGDRSERTGWTTTRCCEPPTTSTAGNCSPSPTAPSATGVAQRKRCRRRSCGRGAGADRYDPQRSTLRTWLYAICRNVVIDATRARAARPTLADAAPPDLPAPERPLEQLLVGLEVEEALRRLSDQHRFVLVEIHLRDRPAAEVAEQLGIPVGTVRSRVYYALKALRLVLEEMGWHGDH